MAEVMTVYDVEDRVRRMMRVKGKIEVLKAIASEDSVRESAEDLNRRLDEELESFIGSIKRTGIVREYETVD